MKTDIHDGLANVAASIGVPGSKQFASTYAIPVYNQHEASAAYATTWMKKIIDLKSDDAFRKWRTWQGDAGQITKITQYENRLKLRDRLIHAYRLAQIYGGAAIYLGGLPGLPSQPVRDNIAAGSLKYITVLPREKCTAGERNDDPTSEGYGEPSFWNVGNQRIHPSRLVILRGDFRPDDGIVQNDGYGLPLWVGLQSAVTNMDSASQVIIEMLFEAKIDIFRIPNLTESFATDGYEQKLIQRIQTANRLKSVANALVLDGGASEGAGEEFETKQLSFASLPDLLDRFMMLLSGAADIPQTKMFGRAPQGMNATGESDAKNWADIISAIQELKINPAIAHLDEYLIKSALGTRPPEMFSQWNSLYSTSEKEGAEIEKSYADGFKIRVETGAIDADALAKSELNRMIETGRYPGIESAIIDAGNEGLPDDDEIDEIERMSREADRADG